MLRGQGVPLPRTPGHLRAAEASPDGHADLSSVATKLALFTVAMVLFPIGTYYLSRDYLFAPTTSLTYPAISAVTVANLVLVGFIYVAFREDMLDSAREQDLLRAQEREKQALLSRDAVSGRATAVSDRKQGGAAAGGVAAAGGDARDGLLADGSSSKATTRSRRRD
ncbi:hypothetical protein JCM8202_003757 [Rhodotorula sphaerocarpa]